jgi:putative heme-binding domain-containing protein
MFSAAGCVVCHRFRGQGGSSGPDLSSLGQRFTLRDVLEATIHPDRAISDQYRLVLLDLASGESQAGLVVSRDEKSTRVATDIMRPARSIEIANADILRLTPVAVSTMPSGLLNALNEGELRDLLSYLMTE